MQSTKCKVEGSHDLAPLGRKCLAMDNSKMVLILFPKDVSLTCSCLRKGQRSPCWCQEAKESRSLKNQVHPAFQSYAFQFHHMHLVVTAHVL